MGKAYYFLTLITAIAVILRILSIPLLGNGLHGNPVDVYYVDTEAAHLVLELQNPYLATTFMNHYGQVVTFTYLPVVPIFYAVFLSTGLDIRAGSIVADVFIIVAMYFTSAQLLKNNAKWWLVLVSPAVYAILPPSILLTSMIGTNVMVGTMFMILTLAAILYDAKILAAIFFGLALAANQFVLLVLPIIALYWLRHKNYASIIISILIACAIILPFLFLSGGNFLYDVLYYQLQRPIQSNGYWDLYYLVYSLSGVKLSTLSRGILFFIPAFLGTWYLSTTKKKLFAGTALVTTLGVAILPVDGFWNYFLIPMAVACSTLSLLVSMWHERKDRVLAKA